MYDLIVVLSLLAGVSAVLIDKTVTRTASAWDCTVFGIFLQTALLVPFFVLWSWPGWGPFAILIGIGLMTGSAGSSGCCGSPRNSSCRSVRVAADVYSSRPAPRGT